MCRRRAHPTLPDITLRPTLATLARIGGNYYWVNVWLCMFVYIPVKEHANS